MLYGGAVLLEGVVLWLLVSGAAGWVVAAAGGLGFALLLAVDWSLERRIPNDSEPF
jgi:hypothetical protein